ncbi:hypothetical protein AMS68_001377 [Peltaster fructicola]|uniref:Rho-GAP domain-containing protein n=1 Tax=Peltaster fructicola TaxID=286661 RepID=A0A6H0XMY9_9PEZI|nr:hypothetical protein AMS68_001377 [Peltaster fructicola]
MRRWVSLCIKASWFLLDCPPRASVENIQFILVWLLKLHDKEVSGANLIWVPSKLFSLDIKRADATRLNALSHSGEKVLLLLGL